MIKAAKAAKVSTLNNCSFIRLPFDISIRRMNFYNPGQNIQRLFHFLAQFLFTTSEMELNYYHQKVNVRVAPRVAERLKTWNLRKLGNFKKIPEILGFDGKYPAVQPKAKF